MTIGYDYFRNCYDYSSRNVTTIADRCQIARRVCTADNVLALASDPHTVDADLCSAPA